MRTIALAAVAMTAFAANSVLARLALADDTIDPGSFTAVRLASGAVILAVLASAHAPRAAWLSAGNWRSAAMLAVYATTFSFAYVTLGAGTGALVLFAAVQAIIFAAAIRGGERPGLVAWSGLALAGVGVALLALPGATAPDPGGAVLMTVAGAAWAGYTLRGRGTERPLATTAANFTRSLPLAAALVVGMLALSPESVRITPWGVLLAVLSGAVASGLGYALWYDVLPRLTRVQSGLVQLTPAPIAMVGGLVVLGEPITSTVAVASLLVLSGVALGSRPRTAG